MTGFWINLIAVIFAITLLLVTDPATKHMTFGVWAAIFCTAQIVAALDRNTNRTR